MLVAIIALQAFTIGLLVGFYGYRVYSRVESTYRRVRDAMDSPPGVVKAERIKATRSQPINLESETGGIMRLSPDQIRIANLKEREEAARRL